MQRGPGVTITVLDYFELHMTGGGGGGLRGPPSDLSPEGAHRRKTWHVPQQLHKEKVLRVIF